MSTVISRYIYRSFLCHELAVIARVAEQRRVDTDKVLRCLRAPRAPSKRADPGSACGAGTYCYAKFAEDRGRRDQHPAYNCLPDTAGPRLSVAAADACQLGRGERAGRLGREGKNGTNGTDEVDKVEDKVEGKVGEGWDRAGWTANGRWPDRQSFRLSFRQSFESRSRKSALP